MSEKYNISSLFDVSGNLTLNAMERYLRNELSPAERILVEKHLAKSDFDCEALEGMQNYGSSDLRQEVEDLQADLLFVAGKRAKTGNSRISRMKYWYAAAGLAGLIGLSVLMFFMFRGPIEKSQLAVMQPDTIIDEIVPITEQAVKNPVQISEDIQKNMPQNEINSPIKPVQEQSSGSIEVAAVSLPPVINQEVIAFNQPVEVAEEIVEVVNDDLIIEEYIVGGVVITNDKDYTEEKLDRSEKKGSTQNIVQSKSAIAEDNSEMSDLESDAQIFMVVESMPEFPGGDSALYRFLTENIHYPDSTKKAGIQGRVFMTFAVNKDGSISDVQVLRGIGGGCDEEALRVVKSMPNWIPGKQRGKPVRVQYNLPIKFSLK
ncbi:MAG: TonB family protein [Bacteroidales bacterium]|nr:TonB family protein [Bacteroidales bacterium]